MQKAAKAGVGCLVILFAMFALIMIFIGRNRPTPEQEAARRRRERDGCAAAYQCQNAVRARLKSPAGAEFQAPRRAAITQYKDGFKVVSYVDAANSFGAKIRTPYTCPGSGSQVIGLDIEN